MRPLQLVARDCLCSTDACSKRRACTLESWLPGGPAPSESAAALGGRAGGAGERLQLADWWADFDERYMRPVFSRMDSAEMQPPDPGAPHGAHKCDTCSSPCSAIAPSRRGRR
jgi:hypothetical protein